MKERPIIFNAERVRAVLDGRMTQTRRVVKGVRYDEVMSATAAPKGHAYAESPYGGIGDRLWVKSDHWRGGGPTLNDQVWDEFTRVTRWKCGREIANHDLCLDEDGKHIFLKRKSSRYMPRWAGRIILEVTDVRVERVSDISEDDAKAEGVTQDETGWWYDYRNGVYSQPNARLSFASLWDSINDKKPGQSWDDNPWVWRISFEVVT